MKRSISLLVIIILLITMSAPLSHAAFANPLAAVDTPDRAGIRTAPEVTAASAMLIDAKTGDMLWRKNSEEKRPIASITKIMTAIVTIKHANLDDTVTVKRDALGPGMLGGVRLAVNERMKLRDLLYALLLPSANDAAVAIADHVGGSVSGFAGMMNSKAALIGAQNTHYMNPHGLDHANHYSTARDLATIARYAMQDKTFAEITSTKTWQLNRSAPGLPTNIKSTNVLLSSYPGANGGKTGYTRKAGNCLVASATRGDVSLISVVLGEKKRKILFKESAALLDFGFSLYGEKKLISKGAIYKTVTSRYGPYVDLVAAEDVSAVVREYLPTRIETQYVSDIDLPVRRGTVLGKVILYQADRVIGASDLVAKEDIEYPVLEETGSYFWAQYINHILKIRA
ncbi:MAG TPA: D-alanyl-D-alanine carboxypeptidase family protein [Anaerolineae bacterium]|nr:D-alanyl-D-alanine carboxypeptidase family protein [Anaerolineae bacterium]